MAPGRATRILGLAAGLSLACWGQACAQTSSDAAVDRYEQGNWAVGAAVSTMGIGPEVTVRLHPNVNFRVTSGFADAKSLASHVNFSTDSTYVATDGQYAATDTKYTISALDIWGARAVIDWHPFRDGGRISIGGGYLDTTGSGTLAVPTSNLKVGDSIYSPAQVKGLGFSFDNGDKFMGYTGLGYDNAFFKDYGLSLSSDFGVMWGYSNDIKLTGGSISTADRAKEQAAIKSKFDNLPVYPIVSIAAKYRF